MLYSLVRVCVCVLLRAVSIVSQLPHLQTTRLTYSCALLTGGYFFDKVQFEPTFYARRLNIFIVTTSFNYNHTYFEIR